MRTSGTGMQAARRSIEEQLPGYIGYEQRSTRAETDRRLRQHVRGEIADLTHRLAQALESLDVSGSRSIGQALEKVRHKLEVIRDGLGENDLGAAELFQREHLEEEVLSQLYRYDLSILRRLAELHQEVAEMKVAEIDPEEPEEALTVVHDLVDGLSQDIFERDTLLEGETEAEY